MRTHGLDITSSESCGATVYFFDRERRKRHIPSRPASRVPRQAFDPLCALTWLILMPLATVAGWEGVFRFFRFLWRLL